jgi:hypothetical protein
MVSYGSMMIREENLRALDRALLSDHSLKELFSTGKKWLMHYATIYAEAAQTDNFIHGQVLPSSLPSIQIVSASRGEACPSAIFST